MAKELGANEAQRESQMYQQRTNMQQENKLKMEYAQLYGKQYGVAADTLLGFNTAVEMEQAAKIAKLESSASVAPGGQKEVPKQTFETGQSAGSADAKTRFAAIGRGEVVPTEADLNDARRRGLVP